MAKQILIVDDEVDIRQLIALILESAGYTVLQATRGTEALEILAKEPCDLVLLDVMMPEMDGWEVCRQIKNNPATREIPVVYLTVRSQPLDRVIGIEVARADEYLTKPFERQELLAVTARFIGTQVAG